MIQSAARRLALVAALLGLVGCSTSPAPSPGQADPYPAPANNPQISVLDPNLQKGIGFQAPTVIPAGQGPLTVQVPVRNLTNYEYLIDYRFLFYDDRGLEQSPTMAWTPVSLLPKQTMNLQGNSLDAEARNWRLEVKWAR